MPGGSAPTRILSHIIARIEGTDALDGVATPLADLVGKAVRPRAVRNLLSGTNLGHPLHPVLTDLPIGAWSMAALLDLYGGRSTDRAARLLVKAGIVAAVPTAVAGLNDWSDTQGTDRRVGLVHAGANSTALLLYLCSARARARGHRWAGKLLGLLGFGVLGAGGYLGGYLSFGRGTNVNRTAWEERPTEWTAVLADAELGDGVTRKVDAAGVPVLLYRDHRQLFALSNTCSHMGGPLDEGTIDDGWVTCPWHGSTFRLSDGTIARGPACVPQPLFETRVQDGRIEVRSS